MYHEWMVRWMGGCMGGQMDARVDGWMHGWMLVDTIIPRMSNPKPYCLHGKLD